MRQLLLASIALGSLVGGSAQAADPWGQPPVYQVASRWPGLFSWSGFYIGGHAGWGWGSFEIDNLRVGPTSRIEVNGVVAGGQVGFNWQWDPIVFGVEFDFSTKGFQGSDDATFGSLDEVGGRWGGTARARLGYAVDRWMFFTTGGFGLLNYRYSSTIVPAGPGFASSNTDNGWVVGGGIEQAFAPNWSAKIEYLHGEYGDLATDEFRFGFNYKFVASY
jgi:outer membrane immunogenic protein